MKKASKPAQLTSSNVRPADRLGFTLLLAAAVHAALILGLSFSLAEPGQISKTLEITLSTFKSAAKPKQADYLAQDNQQGSGTLDKKAAPKTTEHALFQDTQVKRVTPPAAPPASTRKKEAPKAAVATKAPQTSKTQVKSARAKPEEQSRPAPVFDSSQLSSEIASLAAELSQEQQAYAKRPKVNRLNAASTEREVSAWYRDEWRKKVERIGNLNYPAEARRLRIYGNLRLLVQIDRSGSITEMLILESSGQDILDQAALRIVRLAAPFAPFSGELAREFDEIEMIRTWRFERSDHLSSQ